MRRESARHANSPSFTSLIGELSTKSGDFRTLWANQDVNDYRQGRKLIRHPVVGMVDLDYEVLTMPGVHNLLVATYLPRPGGAEAIRALARKSFQGFPEVG